MKHCVDRSCHESALTSTSDRLWPTQNASHSPCHKHSGPGCHACLHGSTDRYVGRPIYRGKGLACCRPVARARLQGDKLVVDGSCDRWMRLLYTNCYAVVQSTNCLEAYQLVFHARSGMERTIPVLGYATLKLVAQSSDVMSLIWASSSRSAVCQSISHLVEQVPLSASTQPCRLALSMGGAMQVGSACKVVDKVWFTARA